VVELHHNDRSPTGCGGAPPHPCWCLHLWSCSHSVCRLWWSSTTVCCCSQQFLLLRSSSTAGIADSRCCVVEELLDNANAPQNLQQNTANVVLCCILQPSGAGELPSIARLQNAATSEQRSNKAYMLTCSAAPLLLLSAGVGDRLCKQRNC
jgi:hypothetical protein